MNDKILKALMQLFAIIGKFETDLSVARRKMEEQFLKQTLNAVQVNEYLKVYDSFIKSYHSEENEGDKKRKVTAVRSVKVLKICDQINEALTQKQKVVVLARLIEYAYSAGYVEEQELEFIETVSSAFHISENEFRFLFDFAGKQDLYDEDPYLLMGENKRKEIQKAKFLHVPHLQGELRVLHVASADVYFLRYYGVIELTLNGQSITDNNLHILSPGSTIRGTKIHPVFFSDILACFYQSSFKQDISFVADQLSYTFSDGQIGLHQLTFEASGGKLMGIMGGSGAGKSTLLNILNGQTIPGSGSVIINGINLYKNPQKLEGVIGFVSQDDLLIEDLTVFQNLYFNAELCFPLMSKDELKVKVEEKLKDFGLYEVRNLKVGDPLSKMISGGQRKRLNIALELIREPSVLFVDEPTSGLSSRDSEMIIDLLKTLALQGKIVFVVIHQPSSDIFKVFDQLLILDKGGYPVYFGNPVEAVTHFRQAVNYINPNESQCILCGNVNPEQIFNIIELKVIDENGLPTRERKISPSEWYDLYLKKCLHEIKQIKTDEPNWTELPVKPGFLQQVKVFIKRDILAKLNNRQYMLINFLEAPVLAVILAWLTRYAAPQHEYTFGDNKNLVAYIFMSVIVALFMGLTVSAEEIFRDRKIRKREAFLNLSKGAYLGSKVALLLGISAIQTLLYVLTGNVILGFKELYFDYWFMLFALAVYANMLGLNISSAFKNAVTIYIIIPFLIIPQLLLSGLLVKYDELSPAMSSKSMVPIAGEMMATRWAFEGIVVNQFCSNSYEKKIYNAEAAKFQAAYNKGAWTDKITDLYKVAEKSKESEEQRIILNELNSKNLLSNHNQLPGKEELNSILSKHKLLEKEKYDEANSILDNYFTQYQTQPEEFKKFKADYFNEKLSELVRNTGNMGEGVFDENGLIFPSENNIYHLPHSNRQIRAHFYSPVKKLGAKFYSTYAINVMVIWGMTLFLYIALYFDWLSKLLKIKIPFIAKKR